MRKHQHAPGAQPSAQGTTAVHSKRTFSFSSMDCASEENGNRPALRAAAELVNGFAPRLSAEPGRWGWRFGAIALVAVDLPQGHRRPAAGPV